MIERLLMPEIQKHFIDIGEKFFITEPVIAGLNQLVHLNHWSGLLIKLYGLTILTAEAVFKTTIETLEALYSSEYLLFA